MSKVGSFLYRKLIEVSLKANSLADLSENEHMDKF
jgi:hypothetical protein